MFATQRFDFDLETDGAGAGRLFGGYDKEHVFYTSNVPATSNKARSRNQCCREKAVNITHSGCVSVPLVIQHVIRMRPIILSSVAYLTLQCFLTLCHKRHDFRKEKFVEHKIGVLIFSTSFV